jgi:hypothetical protein
MKALSARQIGETFEVELLALLDKAHGITGVYMSDASSSIALRVQAMADMADLTQVAGGMVVGAETLLASHPKLKGAADALERVHSLYRVVTADLCGALIRLNKA